MANAKRFSSGWYQFRFIFGLVVFFIGLILFFQSRSPNYLFLALSLGGGLLTGILTFFYYQRHPAKQKDMPVRQRIFTVLSMLILLAGFTRGFSSDRSLELVSYGLLFSGSWIGLFGFLGKR